MNERAIGKKVAIGAVWTVLSRMAVKGLGFISILILARILAPQDFGVIAATMMMVGLFEILFNFGFDVNIIQRKDIRDSTLNSAWTCKLLSGLVIGLLLLVLAPTIAGVFHDPRLVHVVWAISVLPVLKGATNIGFVLYRKELDLKSEFKLETYSKVFSFIVTLTLAFWLQSYWALLIGIYSNALSKLFCSFAMHPYRPKFDVSEAKELFQFSKWLLLRNATVYVNTSAPAFLIGKLAGTTQLGYFSISHEIANLPTTEILYPLSRAAYPGYVKLSDQPVALSQFFLKISRLVVFFLAPLSFGLAATSAELVAILLGSQWLEVTPLLALLAIFGFIRASSQTIEAVFIALGKPKLCFYIMFVLTSIYIPLLYAGYYWQGATGVVYAMIANISLYTMVSFGVLQRYLPLPTLQILRIYFFPVLLAASMYGLLVWGVPVLFPEVGSNLFLLLIKVLFGVLYFALMVVLHHLLLPASSRINEILLVTKSLRATK